MKSRAIHNYLTLFGILVVLVFAFSSLSWMLSIPMLVGDAVAIGIVYYLFTQWDKRAIGMHCNHCLKYLASNTPWVCGYCKKPNNNANDYPFVGPCAHCGNEPKAYKCHRAGCKQIIFLSEDRDDSNYAYCLNEPTESSLDAPKNKALEMEEARREKDHEVVMAALDVKLKESKNQLVEPKIKTPYEIQQEKFTRFYQGAMGAEDIADRALAAARVEFKDDLEALARRETIIKEWRRMNVP
jgi:hypothetical protein